MTQLIFKHPKMNDDLNVSVKPNSIEWSYKLNTANYSTYGGEVIQILSVYIDDLAITGEVENYRQMENIFRWFTNYIQLATQGSTGQGSDGYDSTPVTMVYPERDWQFKIVPMDLPSFKYGRDIVVPEWQMRAAVAEQEWGVTRSSTEELGAVILSTKGINSVVQSEGIDLFGKATINTSSALKGVDSAFDYNPDDPFSGPVDVDPKTGKPTAYSKDKLRGAYNDLADRFNKLIPAYMTGDFHDLSADYSKPAFSGGAGGGNTNTGTTNAQKIADNASNAPKG